MATKDPPGGPPKTDRQKKEQHGTKVLERTQRPGRHKVIMHNDDFTPMEFVTHVLEAIFHKSTAEATRIMLTVHTTGIGIAGVYSKEVAETKTATCISLARKSGFPLLVTSEPE